MPIPPERDCMYLQRADMYLLLSFFVSFDGQSLWESVTKFWTEDKNFNIFVHNFLISISNFFFRKEIGPEKKILYSKV